jgi:response regulator RpfG family c-di-GMP phosphodiesterase
MSMNDKKSLHFLIVEDEIEIAEIISLFLGGQYNAQFTIAASGNEAVNVLKEHHSQFHMVLSDFNMPNGNGGVLFQYMRTSFPDLPFVLITSDSWHDHREFHNFDNVGYVQKPFVDDTLVQEVDRILNHITLHADRDHQYVGISIQTLAKISEISYPLYVKLNDEKYIKIMNVSSSFSDEEVERFRTKQLKMLYVERQYYNEFIKKFSNKVVNDMIFRGLKVGSIEALSLSTSVQEIIMGAVKTFGWSQETQDMAIKNLQIVKDLVEKTVELHSIFQWAKDTDHDYVFVHSILNCFMTTSLAISYKFKLEYAQEYLALASFFHDTALEPHQVKNESRFLKAAELKLPINKEDWLWIQDHPESSANMLALWPPCPQEVVRIIRQHHERPDGKGFPDGLSADAIDELSACFIVAEEVVLSYLELKDRLLVEKHLKSREDLYSVEPFNKFYKLALEIFYNRKDKAKSA